MNTLKFKGLTLFAAVAVSPEQRHVEWASVDGRAGLLVVDRRRVCGRRRLPTIQDLRISLHVGEGG